MPRTPWMLNGPKLKCLRTSRGWSRRELAQQAGGVLASSVAEKTIERYEDSAYGTRDIIEAIATVLGVDWKELLDPRCLPMIGHYLPTFLTGANEEEFHLLYKSFECYTAIFPDERERNDPQDMVTWLHKRRNAERMNDPWRDVYAVLHAGEDVIGMAYIFVHLGHPWAFGAYFGIIDRGRNFSRADTFLEAIVERVRITNPHVRAIVFEVDPIDFTMLGEALSDITHVSESEELLAMLKAIRRLLFFQESCGARVILGSDGHPLPYWEPSWDNPKDVTDETEGVENILMIRPLEGRRVANSDIPDILNFVFDVIYMYDDGEEDVNNTWPRWIPHIAKIKSRIFENIEKANIGKLQLPTNVYQLLSRFRGKTNL